MSAPENPPTSADIDRRLRIVAELRNLCLSLGRARKVAAAPPDGGEAAEAPTRPPPVTPSDRPASR